MLKTVVAIERDGLDVRVLALNFEIPNEEFDLMAAVRAAALEYCLTEEGKAVYSYNCSSFNWADFAMSVPKEICRKYGFSVLESPVADEIVNWDEELVDDAELREEDKVLAVDELISEATKKQSCRSAHSLPQGKEMRERGLGV